MCEGTNNQNFHLPVEKKVSTTYEKKCCQKFEKMLPNDSVKTCQTFETKICQVLQKQIKTHLE